MRMELPRRNGRGFTLVELMIAIAVLAILTSIAYPMYLDQVRKSRRAAATGSMLLISQFMERNFTETRDYSTLSGGGALDLNAIFNATYIEDRDVAEKYYDLVLATTANTYSIQAVPKGGQVDDKCKTMGLTSLGDKTTNSSYDCW